MALLFSSSDKLKQELMESQKKEIEALYKSWSDDLAKKAKKYAASPAPSAELAEKQTKILMKQMKATGQQISNEVYGKIKHNMYVVSEDVVKTNKSWLYSLGFNEYKKNGVSVAFGSVPDTVVRNLVTGKIYDSGWSLSKRIWGSNEETMKDAYGIVAKGLAENSPIADIAKELSRLVDPSAAKPWNPVVAMKNTKTGKIEYKRIYGRKVDYNAQRLARTLVQHSYQQSVIAVTENNPLIENYIWHSNGSRVCEICQDRDGRVFKKGDVPMDHPNGMCFIEPVVDKDMVDKLADWFNSPDGTYPEFDEFAKEFGYEANSSVASSLIDKYNLSQKAIDLAAKSNDYMDWMVSLPTDEFAKLMSAPDLEDLFNEAKAIKNAEISAIKSKIAPTSKVYDPLSEDVSLWLKDMQFNDLSKMNEWCDEWKATISSEELDGVIRYTGNSYRQMNNILRFGREYDADIQERMIERINNCEAALAKAKLPEQVIARRGSDYNVLQELGFGSKMTEEEVKSVIGGLVEEKGFLSTSPDPKGGFTWYDYEYVIKVPEGSQAMYVDSISMNRGEKELLINKDGRYQITDVKLDGLGNVKQIFMALINLQ